MPGIIFIIEKIILDTWNFYMYNYYKAIQLDTLIPYQPRKAIQKGGAKWKST